MGAAGDLRAHQGILCVKCVSVDLLQVISSRVIVSVSGGAVEMLRRDPVLLHGSDHLQLVCLRRFVIACKPLLQRIAHLIPQFHYPPGDAHLFIQSLCAVSV